MKMNILFIALGLSLFSISNAYVVSIHAPAVLSNEYRGTLTVISLNVTQGNGQVSIIGPLNVSENTQLSAHQAVGYAAQYLGISAKRYNFTYTIEGVNTDVSGPSAGLAFTVLAIDGLNHRQPYNGFTLTGTINANGTVGLIGGIYDKAGAAAQNGMKYIVVPYAPNGSEENFLYYLSQQTYNIPVVEVKNVSQALIYANSDQSQLAENNRVSYSFPSVNYLVASLPNANVTCTSCNTSYFSQLDNFTFNLTRSEIESISRNYTSLKPALLAQLGTYESISKKGYLYTAADLSFLEYINAFDLANQGDFGLAPAESFISNVSSYCSSLTQPQMTNLNYEYLISGQVRQEWGESNIATVSAELNNSNITDSTDAIIIEMQGAAESYAWCVSASKMFGIAASIGGNATQFSSGIRNKALQYLNTAKQYSTQSIYTIAAENAYSSGEYGASIYSSIYSSTIGNSQATAGLSSGAILNMTYKYAVNATFGEWPAQFANSAIFYADEAKLHGGNEAANITSAFSLTMLADSLSTANSQAIAAEMVPVAVVQNSSTTTPAQSHPSAALTASLQSEINLLEVILGLVVIITASLVVTLIVTIMKLNALEQKLERRNAEVKAGSGKRSRR